jgi:hypothetical protein
MYAAANPEVTLSLKMQLEKAQRFQRRSHIHDEASENVFIFYYSA